MIAVKVAINIIEAQSSVATDPITSEAWKVLKTAAVSGTMFIKPSVEVCPYYYKDRIPVNENETSFEVVSLCTSSGKLPPVG